MACLIIGSFMANDTKNLSIHFKLTIPLILMLASIVFLYLFKIAPMFIKYFPTCMSVLATILVTEKFIIKDPKTYSFAEPYTL